MSTCDEVFKLCMLLLRYAKYITFFNKICNVPMRTTIMIALNHGPATLVIHLFLA